MVNIYIYITGEYIFGNCFAVHTYGTAYCKALPKTVKTDFINRFW